MRVLIPIDGSAAALTALERLLDKAGWYSTPLEIHLLNVQRPLPQNIGRFVAASALHQFHQEQGMACLQPAIDKLAGRGVACQSHVAVGEAAESIVNFARQHHCDQIVVGPRGLGALPGLLLGSVTTRVLQISDTPVLILR